MRHLMLARLAASNEKSSDESGHVRRDVAVSVTLQSLTVRPCIVEHYSALKIM
jgi:hypothetical protein